MQQSTHCALGNKPLNCEINATCATNQREGARSHIYENEMFAECYGREDTGDRPHYRATLEKIAAVPAQGATPAVPSKVIAVVGDDQLSRQTSISMDLETGEVIITVDGQAKWRRKMDQENFEDIG